MATKFSPTRMATFAGTTRGHSYWPREGVTRSDFLAA
jgi:hypothetical protein